MTSKQYSIEDMQESWAKRALEHFAHGCTENFTCRASRIMANMVLSDDRLYQHYLRLYREDWLLSQGDKILERAELPKVRHSGK